MKTQLRTNQKVMLSQEHTLSLKHKSTMSVFNTIHQNIGLLFSIRKPSFQNTLNSVTCSIGAIYQWEVERNEEGSGETGWKGTVANDYWLSIYGSYIIFLNMRQFMVGSLSISNFTDGVLQIEGLNRYSSGYGNRRQRARETFATRDDGDYGRWRENRGGSQGVRQVRFISPSRQFNFASLYFITNTLLLQGCTRSIILLWRFQNNIISRSICIHSDSVC